MFFETKMVKHRGAIEAGFVILLLAVVFVGVAVAAIPYGGIGKVLGFSAASSSGASSSLQYKEPPPGQVPNQCSDARATTLQFASDSPLNSTNDMIAVTYRGVYMEPDARLGELIKTVGSTTHSATISADTDLNVLACPAKIKVYTLGGQNVSGRWDVVDIRDPYPTVLAENPVRSPVSLFFRTYQGTNDTQTTEGGAVSDLNGGNHVTSTAHAMTTNDILTGKLDLRPNAQVVAGNYFTNELIISVDLGSTAVFSTDAAFDIVGDGFTREPILDPKGEYGITGTNVYAYKIKAMTSGASKFKGARTDLLDGVHTMTWTLTADIGDPTADVTFTVLVPGYYVENDQVKYGAFDSRHTQIVGLASDNVATLDLS